MDLAKLLLHGAFRGRHDNVFFVKGAFSVRVLVYSSFSSNNHGLSAIVHS